MWDDLPKYILIQSIVFVVILNLVNSRFSGNFLRPHTLECPGRATGATSTTCLLNLSLQGPHGHLHFNWVKYIYESIGSMASWMCYLFCLVQGHKSTNSLIFFHIIIFFKSYWKECTLILHILPKKRYSNSLSNLHYLPSNQNTIQWKTNYSHISTRTKTFFLYKLLYNYDKKY
jgi:hypothetical protein